MYHYSRMWYQVVSPLLWRIMRWMVNASGYQRRCRIQSWHVVVGNIPRGIHWTHSNSFVCLLLLLVLPEWLREWMYRWRCRLVGSDIRLFDPHQLFTWMVINGSSSDIAGVVASGYRWRCMQDFIPMLAVLAQTWWRPRKNCCTLVLILILQTAFSSLNSVLGALSVAFISNQDSSGNWWFIGFVHSDTLMQQLAADIFFP